MYYWNKFFFGLFRIFPRDKKDIYYRKFPFIQCNDNEFFPQEKTVTKTERSYIIIPPK